VFANVLALMVPKQLAAVATMDVGPSGQGLVSCRSGGALHHPVQQHHATNQGLFDKRAPPPVAQALCLSC